MSTPRSAQIEARSTQEPLCWATGDYLRLDAHVFLSDFEVNEGATLAEYLPNDRGNIRAALEF